MTMQIRSPRYGVVVADEPVFVPGIGLYTETGEPYARGMARVDVVTNSLQNGIAIPDLYLTGGKATESRPSEADAIERELYARLGADMLSGTNIIKETTSTNTLQNFINIADAIASQKPDALSLVTDAPHMPRILTIARKIVHKSTQLVPVITKHIPILDESAREVLALPLTAITLFSVPVGDTEALNNRVHKYTAVKQKVVTALHKH